MIDFKYSMRRRITGPRRIHILRSFPRQSSIGAHRTLSVLKGVQAQHGDVCTIPTCSARHQASFTTSDRLNATNIWNTTMA